MLSAPQLRPAARAVVLDAAQRVLLVHFVFGTVEDLPNGLWACPGGGIEPAETLADGLRRELREELGLDIVDVGPPIWRKEHVFPMDSGWAGQCEVLMLHRAQHGPDYTGDWAWTPPAGARLPGEPVQDCARRQLREETGLVLPLEPTPCGTDDWCVYLAEAPPAAAVVIDAEHDRFEWLPMTLASSRCKPDLARTHLVAAIAQVRLAAGFGGQRRTAGELSQTARRVAGGRVRAADGRAERPPRPGCRAPQR